MENTLPKYQSIIDNQVAASQIKANAIKHSQDNSEGYGKFVTLGYYGIWHIVARATYNPLLKTFSYDGGIQLGHGGSCDRQGGYTSLTHLIQSAVLKAEKNYLED